VWPNKCYLRSALALAGALLVFPALADTAVQAQRSLLLDATELSDKTLLAVGERGHILRSTDSGKNWALAPSPSPVLLTSITAFDKTILAAGHNTTVLRSTDAGQNWTKVFDTTQLPADDLARDAPVLDITCPAPPRCEAVGGYGLWLRSQDGGATWQREYIKESDSHKYALMPVKDGLLVVGEAGQIMKYGTSAESDGLGDWIALLPPQGGSLFGVVRGSQNTLMAYGLSGRIVVSRDEGQSWENLKTGMDTGLMGAATLRNGNTLFVGVSGALLEWNPLSGEFLLQRRNNRKTFSQVLETRSGQVWLLGETGISLREEPHAGR
jgi:photosystem II stability/assembly factor-like uncharacterized protein